MNANQKWNQERSQRRFSTSNKVSYLGRPAVVFSASNQGWTLIRFDDDGKLARVLEADLISQPHSDKEN